ncbi:MAG: multidrug efflux pump subunit AcrB [Verrucomicrobiales bacterium]|jgi:multidrug efflux pump subunit AcrB
MEKLIYWFSRNHVAANFIMAGILLLGITTWFKLKKEIFPETATDIITILVPYPNASPEEVEKSICIPIEEAIQGVDGIDRIKSTSTENRGVVIVETANGYKVRNVMDDLKAQVDAIDSFPENAEEPIIAEVLIKSQVLSVAVSANTDEKTLRAFAEDIRDGLLNQKEITQVELYGVRPYEISIEVSEDTLRAYQLTLSQVANAVRASSLDLPGGSVRTDAGEVLIKAEGKRYTEEEFGDITLISRDDGTVVKLRDIATIIDGFEDIDLTSRFEGAPAVVVNVFRVGDQDTLVVANDVKNYLEQARRDLPTGVTVEVWNDTSVMLAGRLDLLKRNGLMGLALVFIVLALFLRPSLAFLVSVGIPVSFAGAIWMMPQVDISINMITLFAFILVLGIVVDDAIVVGENVYARMQRGEHPREAAWKGTHEVGVVVIFGVLTTAVAFTPMLMVSGVSGKIWRNIPLIVIPTLIFSLLQSKLILPAHLACLRPSDPNRKLGPIMRLQKNISNGLEVFVEKFYRPVLKLALHSRYVTLTIFIAVLAVTITFVSKGHIRFQFFPEVEAEIISAKLTMPNGVPFETTTTAVIQIEKAVGKLNERFTTDPEKPLVLRTLTSVGSQPFKVGFTPITPTGVNVGEVTIELAKGSDRETSAKEIAAVWRELAGAIPGAVELTFQSEAAGGGNAIDIELVGTDSEQVNKAVGWVKERLRDYRGVIDITDGNRAGKREIKLKRLLPQGEALGLRLSDVSSQIRNAFYGEEAQQLQRGRDEVKVFVRYPRDERRSVENIEQMKIRTADGTEIPLSEIAEVEFGRSFATIQRTDRLRAVRVAADIDKTDKKADANEVVKTLTKKDLSQIAAKFPGVSYSFEGEQKDQRQSLAEMGVGFIFAMLAVYVLMAIPLGSYVQPIIVMSVIPFGFVGAVAGHILMDTPLSIMSMCGIVALGGVVVNDSLVLVDYVNRHRNDGHGLIEAVWNAGAARFRPIILTSLTTFAGLTPMLLETDLQAKFLIPMAISLGFGILFATFITLLLIPCVYLMLEDVKKFIFTKETLDEWEERSREEAKAKVRA